MLGICYGMQLACQVLGGEVQAGAEPRVRPGPLPRHEADGLFAGRARARPIVWMSHGDQVQTVSGDFVPLAATDTCPVAAVRHRSRPVYGLQFHPEVSHTPHGSRILRNFLYDVCGCHGPVADAVVHRADRGRAAAAHRRRTASSAACPAASIRRWRRRCWCGRSGRRSRASSWTTACCGRAKRRRCARTFRDHFQADLHVVDAARPLPRARWPASPIRRRSARIIGHVFIDVFKDEAQRIEDAQFLAQGTLYPDVIESGGAADGPAATIKTHHNVGGLPEELGFELIEPLRDLFKDEVRRLGLELGLPETIVWRHPFPGPGLAVRCLGRGHRDAAGRRCARPTRSCWRN